MSILSCSSQIMTSHHRWSWSFRFFQHMKCLGNECYIFFWFTRQLIPIALFFFSFSFFDKWYANTLCSHSFMEKWIYCCIEEGKYLFMLREKMDGILNHSYKRIQFCNILWSVIWYRQKMPDSFSEMQMQKEMQKERKMSKELFMPQKVLAHKRS